MYPSGLSVATGGLAWVMLKPSEEVSRRLTTVARRLLGVIRLFVVGGRFEDGALLLRIRPSWR